MIELLVGALALGTTLLLLVAAVIGANELEGKPLKNRFFR